jgi:CHASE3 domain sensor protein
MARGKSSMDRIREHISRMEREENAVLQQRERTKDEYVRLTPVSLLFWYLLCWLLSGFPIMA